MGSGVFRELQPVGEGLFQDAYEEERPLPTRQKGVKSHSASLEVAATDARCS